MTNVEGIDIVTVCVVCVWTVIVLKRAIIYRIRIGLRVFRFACFHLFVPFAGLLQQIRQTASGRLYWSHVTVRSAVRTVCEARGSYGSSTAFTV